MIRYFQFYIASTFLLGALIYWPLANFEEQAEAGKSAEIRSQDVLHREAKMVDYFCLSKIPPVSGKATIPKSWEKALQSTIDLRENAAEVTGTFPELSGMAKELNLLSAGEAVYSKSETRHVLAFRPKQSPNWFIVITKPLNGIQIAADGGDSGSDPLRTAISFALFGSLLLTIMAHFVMGGNRSAKSE
jgi:hypothetical protein